MSLENLAQYLQVEQQLRQKDAQDDSVIDTSKVHMVEEKQANNATQNSFNKKRKGQNNKNFQNKKAKATNGCYHCGKPGQFKRVCRILKKKQ